MGYLEFLVHFFKENHVVTLTFAFVTLVNYFHSLTVWLILQLFTVKFENFRPPAQGVNRPNLEKLRTQYVLKYPIACFGARGFIIWS